MSARGGDRRVVAIVGGGIAGLAAARELVARGFEARVFEAEGRPGGMIRSERAEGFLLEHAANGFLAGDPRGAAPLSRELGVDLAAPGPAAARRWVYRGGALREVPTSPAALARTDLLSWRGKVAALAEPLARPAPADEDETIAAFARRRFGAEVERALVSPFTTGVFGGEADALSLRAAMPALAAYDRRGGVLRSALADGARLAARRALGRAPRSSGRGLLAPVGGAEEVPRALCAELGDRVRLGARVEEVSGEPGRVFLRGAGGADEGPYPAVVLAVPAPAAARLVRPGAPDFARALDAIPHAPIAAIHLGYRLADVEHPLNGFGFLVAPGEAPRILGAVFESSIFPRRAPEGFALVRAMVGGARDSDLVDEAPDALVAHARRELEPVLGVRAPPALARAVRWRPGIPQYTPGHEARVSRAEAAAARCGAVLAGSAYRGVAVNKLVGDAARVAGAVMDRLGAAASAAAFLASALLLACSGGQKSDDASPAEQERGGEAREARAGEVAPGESDPEETGSIRVSAEWLPPPPELIRAPGINACGAERRAPLEVDVMGGVEGAVALLVGDDLGPDRAGDEGARVSIASCRAGPRASVATGAGAIEIENRSERRSVVEISRAGDVGGGPLGDEVLATVPTPLVGQRVSVPVADAGVYALRTRASPEEPAFVVAPGHRFAAVTGEGGEAIIRGAPVGTHELKIWHPPVRPDGDALTRRARVRVEEGEEAEVSLSFAPAGAGGDAARAPAEDDEGDGGA